MKRNTTIMALVLGFALFGLACSKSGTAVANMSEDDKHKLFQAVGITQDTALILKAMQSMGLADSSGNPTPAMEPFVKAHYEWAPKNADFVKEHLSKDKAMEYAKAHMP
ncbi:MAG TPA: hypothetical protein VJT09_00500 [Pyrinomonadaceae bacterium]|nr:hypothetical protein [Pyrinomonadaceae bacterium]